MTAKTTRPDRVHRNRPRLDSDAPTHVYSDPPSDSSMLPPPMVPAEVARELHAAGELGKVRDTVGQHETEIQGLRIEMTLRFDQLERAVKVRSSLDTWFQGCCALCLVIAVLRMFTS